MFREAADDGTCSSSWIMPRDARQRALRSVAVGREWREREAEGDRKNKKQKQKRRERKKERARGDRHAANAKN